MAQTHWPDEDAIGNARGTRVAAVGAGIGVVAAFGLTRLMGKLLYGVALFDPMTFVVVTVVLCGVAAVASSAGATRDTSRRATRIDPLTALRSD